MLSGIGAAGAQTAKSSAAPSNENVIPNFWKSLIAVVVGNLVYFFVMFPYLPPAARHAPNRLDFGLLVDFGVCVLVFAALEFGTRSFGTPRGPSHRA